ncbi:MAG: TATA-box-binding protein [Thermoplasmata archaeon]|nr:TATA-box-binding protein [Thermoplasmata archaeon]
MSMVKVKVDNIVATSRLAEGFDLSVVGEHLIGAAYNPDQFEGVLYKLLDPKAAFLLLKNGKAICTGLKKMEQIEAAYKKLSELLEKEGISTTTPKEDDEALEIGIKNIVASMDLAQEIDLEMTVNVLENDAEYDPELFPGVIYHIKEPRSTALIFSAGKVAFTGPKDMDELKQAVEVVLENLESAGAVVV